jgi:uncharacterized membrane protein
VRYAVLAPLWLGWLSLVGGLGSAAPYVAAAAGAAGLLADGDERAWTVADLGALALREQIESLRVSVSELVEAARDRLETADVALAAAVLATHGVLDTVVTAWGIHVTGRTSVEANPLLDSSVHAAFDASFHSGLWAAVRAVAVPKVPAVAVAVALLLLAHWAVPRRAWRAGAGVFAGSGLVVVASNLWELSTSYGVTLL